MPITYSTTSIDISIPSVAMDTSPLSYLKRNSFYAPGVYKFTTPALSFDTSPYIYLKRNSFYVPNASKFTPPVISFDKSFTAYLKRQSFYSDIGVSILQYYAKIWIVTDRTSEIIFTVPTVIAPIQSSVSIVLGNDTSKIEILYPIVPVPIFSREINQKDNQIYSTIIKPSGDKVLSTLKLRIKDSYLSTFIGILRTFRTAIIELNTPAIYPFGNGYTKSNVYLVDYTKPQLEKAQYWRMDIRVIQISGVS